MRTVVVTYKCDRCWRTHEAPFVLPSEEEEEECHDTPKGWFFSPIENKDYCDLCLAEIVPRLNADGSVSPAGTY
jgi:hypothetical protein